MTDYSFENIHIYRGGVWETFSLDGVWKWPWTAEDVARYGGHFACDERGYWAWVPLPPAFDERGYWAWVPLPPAFDVAGDGPQALRVKVTEEAPK